MTETELKSLYTEAVKICRAERKMRVYVFRDRPDVRDAKVREMDRLLHILAQLKDVAKAACDDGYEQPVLLDVPAKTQYP